MKVQEIVHNLVDNAVKFTTAGTIVVHATVLRGNDRVAIEVRDTGCGIPAEELAHVFEEFRQVGDSRTRDTSGVGLGLSIVKRLVTVLGGTVSVSSRVGVGSTFRVELPVRAAQAETAPVEPGARAGDPTPGPRAERRASPPQRPG